MVDLCFYEHGKSCGVNNSLNAGNCRWSEIWPKQRIVLGYWNKIRNMIWLKLNMETLWNIIEYPIFFILQDLYFAGRYVFEITL